MEASVQLIREVTEVRLVLEEYLAHLVVERPHSVVHEAGKFQAKVEISPI